MQQHDTKRRKIRKLRRRVLACLSQLGYIQGALGGVLVGYGTTTGVVWAFFYGLLCIELLRQGLAWHYRLWALQKTAWAGLLAGVASVIPTALLMLAVSMGNIEYAVVAAGTNVGIGTMLIVGACLGSQQATARTRYEWTPFGLGLAIGLGLTIVAEPERWNDRLIGPSLACLGLMLTESLIDRYSPLQKQPRWLRKNTDLPVRTLTPD
jgi:hypothetical protein